MQVSGTVRDGRRRFGLIAQEPGKQARSFAELGVEIERCTIISKGRIMPPHAVQQNSAIGIDASGLGCLADCLIVKLKRFRIPLELMEGTRKATPGMAMSRVGIQGQTIGFGCPIIALIFEEEVGGMVVPIIRVPIGREFLKGGKPDQQSC